MSLILRYSDIRRGGIVFTGNTLGLSKRQDMLGMVLKNLVQTH